MVIPFQNLQHPIHISHSILPLPPSRPPQTSGAEKIIYGCDGASDSSTVVIVEGEIDKLSLDEAGVVGAVSVPDGAPAKARPESEASPASFDPEQDVKFSYVWQVRWCAFSTPVMNLRGHPTSR